MVYQHTYWRSDPGVQSAGLAGGALTSRSAGVGCHRSGPSGGCGCVAMSPHCSGLSNPEVPLAWGWCGGVHVLSSISAPSSPYSGEEGPLRNRFSIELTAQCDGCLFWGLGWQAGLVAELRVGQAYWVFH